MKRKSLYKALRYIVMMLVLAANVMPALAQIQSGYYRIKSTFTINDASVTGYLWPSSTTVDNHNYNSNPEEAQFVATYPEPQVSQAYSQPNCIGENCVYYPAYNPIYSIWKLETVSVLNNTYTFKSFGFGKTLIYTNTNSPNTARSLLQVVSSVSNSEASYFCISPTRSYIYPSSMVENNSITPLVEASPYLSAVDENVEPNNAARQSLICIGNGNGVAWTFEPVTVEAPSFFYNLPNASGKVTINHPESSYATIKYSTGQQQPNTVYDVPFPIDINNVNEVRAQVSLVGYNNEAINSDVTDFQPTRVNAPTISIQGATVEITSSTNNTFIYYTINGETPSPTSSSSIKLENGGSFTFNSSSGIIMAVAVSFESPSSPVKASVSPVTTKIIGNQAQVHPIKSCRDFSAMEGSSDIFIIENDIDINDCNRAFSSIETFSGTLQANIDPDTKMPYRIKNLNVPLFKNLKGTVKNLVLEDVNIPSNTSGNVGAIAVSMEGTSTQMACIYNCGILSGSVGGTGNVGGLVGVLGVTGNNNINCYARVINCYSYADITGGSVKAGIVGYNNYGSKSGDIRTMVLNCMFYGNIAETEGNKISPIYGGTQIKNNDDDKLNNYNYFCYENLPSGKITNYNTALAAEERYLVRFEFYRLLLNSTRELAAYYVGATLPDFTGGEKRYDKSQIAKWVLDKSVAPYPILKVQDYYPSIINYDATTAPQTPESIKTLTVTLTGTGITTTSLSLPITDKDPTNYNYNYHKVQLPYFNDVGTGNYQNNKAVTGWKITAMTGGTQGNYYSDSYDVTMSPDGNSITKTPYNFADRSTYAKDLYPNQVYSQGAYFNVPDGVTGITIEPYWADCVYLSDPYYDKYGYAKGDVTDFGKRYVNGNNYSINGSSQTVYTSVGNAHNALSKKSSVYDNAIVLVGNYHKGDDNELSSSNAKPYTLMSIDLDNDNEPDYSIIFRSGKQKDLYSIRYDFINMPGAAMAHKTPSNGNMGIPGNCKVKGWFEITNTALIRFNQFEYDNNYKNLPKTSNPLILLGGVIEQFVSTNYADDNGNAHINNTTNIHIGGNVWFKLFSNGVHADKTQTKTARRPISVTGGEYEVFYLSGYFQPEAPYFENESAECYIDGGKFGEVAGAGQEKIDGNVTWAINHAFIEKFYGGGINPKKSISGNVFVDIKNSSVGVFCGGPKFGDMGSAKTVKTFADHCTFGTYFGAGYGGTALVRNRTFNDWNNLNVNWNTGSNTVGTFTSGSNKRGTYDLSKGGVSISYEYEHFEGSNDKTVARFYVNYASLSKAQTNDVVSSLTHCTITGNFYGGGNLGKVEGDARSTLTNCTVNGSVFGAGYSATAPTANVFPATGFTNHVASPEELNRPRYNSTTGVFEKGEYPVAVSYTWSSDYGSTSSTLTDNDAGHWIYTTAESLSGLGLVSGNTILTLKGTTTVMGSVFGGGDMSGVSGNCSVFLQNGTSVTGNVYGGGNEGPVGGNSEVIIQDN